MIRLTYTKCAIVAAIGIAIIVAGTLHGLLYVPTCDNDFSLSHPNPVCGSPLVWDIVGVAVMFVGALGAVRVAVRRRSNQRDR